MNFPQPPIEDDGASTAPPAASRAIGSLPSDRIQQLVVLGYITAVAMPPVGLIVGLVLAARLTTNSRRGIWIIVVSIIAALVWILALATGLLNPNSNASSS